MQIKNKWLVFTGLTIAAIALAGVLILPTITFAQGPGSWNNGQTPFGQNENGWQDGRMGGPNTGYGWQGGMMGGSNTGYGWQNGRMGGFMNSLMGSGMMGGFNNQSSGPRLTLDDAYAIAADYAQNYNAAAPLEVKEVMEFDNNFYAEIAEGDTGIGAFEILIDPVTGYVHPEPGPNMMWNTKYGIHGGSGGMMGGMMGGNWGFNRPSGEMTITPEQALDLAQRYLDQTGSGLTVGDEVSPFYGYYTLHTLNDGEIEGMFSINGSTGQIWYHNWHGDFAGMTADEHD